MKRILYILTMMSLFASCVKLEKESVPDILTPVEQTSNGEKVTAKFVVELAEAKIFSSKTMSDTPDIQTMRVAVFDEGGMLSEYVIATPQQVNGNGDTNTAIYTVSLSSSDYKHILHFIANGPEALSYGSENEIIGGLCTTGTQDAYWQRVEVPHLKEDPNNPGKLHPEAQNKIATVGLIRNFCKITISASPDIANKFIIKGFYTIYTMKKGSIAPYNRKTGKFVEDYQKYPDIEELIKVGDYHANVPVDAEINTEFSQEYVIPGEDNTGSNTAYIYEREVPTSYPTFVIVKGKYNDGVSWRETYYKIDLINDKAEYFPFLRNFNYKINVRNVTKEGCATKEEALQAPGSGALSTSLESNALTNISDGISRLFVEYTEKVIVGEVPALFRFKYIPKLTDVDANGTAVIRNDLVTLTEGEFGATGSAIDHIEIITLDADDHFAEAWVYPTAVSAVVKNQDLIVTGDPDKAQPPIFGPGEEHTAMVRNVKFFLREKLDMALELTPDSIAKGEGQSTVLSIKIPDGLPSSIFSLDFLIEAKPLTISSDNDPLPVRTEESIIPGNSDPAFQFVKTISWYEYSNAPTGSDGFKSFECKFRTNQANSATTLYVVNDFFSLANVSLTNYDGASFQNLQYSKTSGVHEGDIVTFSAELSAIPESGDISVTLTNLSPNTESGAEKNLTFVKKVDETTALYSFPSSKIVEQGGKKSISFQLKVDSYNSDGVVILNAKNFVESRASITPVKGVFSSPEWIGKPAGSDPFYFQFKMDAVPQNNQGRLKVHLANATPADGTLEAISAEPDYYYYTPVGTSADIATKTQSFGLIRKGPGSVTVYISESHFLNELNESISSNKNIVIPAGLILKNDTSNQCFGSSSNKPANNSTVAVQTSVKHESYMQNPAVNLTITQTSSGFFTKTYSYSNRNRAVIEDVDLGVNKIYFYYVDGTTVYLGTSQVDENGNLIGLTNNTVKMKVKRPLDTPENVRTTARTYTSISIAWDAVPDADHYLIHVTPRNGGQTIEYSTWDANPWIDLGLNGHTPELARNTEYVITVQACSWTQSTESDWSDPLYDRTKGKLDKPKMSITSTATTMTFSWNAVQNASKYAIRVYGPNDVLIKSDNNITTTSVKVTNLSPNYTYYYALLKAVGDDRFDDSDEVRNGETTKAQTILDAPGNIRCTSQLRSKLTFAWNSVSHATGYRVLLMNGNTVIEEKDITATNYTFEGLHSNTNYTFKVKALGDDDYYASSAYSGDTQGKTTTTKIIIDVLGNRGENNRWLKLNGDDVLSGVSGNTGNRIVVGQTGTLTAYVNDSGLSNVKIKGITATQGNGSITADNETYYPYYVSYTAPNHTNNATSGKYDEAVVTAENEASTSLNIAVYEITKGNSVTSIPSGWTVMDNENKGYEGFIYKMGNSIEANIQDKQYYDYNYLYKFNNTSGTKVTIRNAAASSNVTGTDSGNYFSFSSSGTTYNFYVARDNARIYLAYSTTILFVIPVNTVWARDTNKTSTFMTLFVDLLINDPSDNALWKLYPVSFLAP